VSSAPLTLAASLRRLKLFRLARFAVDIGLRASPRDLGLIRERIALATHRGDLQGATEDYKRLLALDPTDADSAKNAAMLELLGGNVEAARAVLRSARASGTLRIVNDALIDPARAAAEQVYVSVLRNVDVETAYWSILNGDRVYNFEANCRALPNNPFVQGRTTPDRKTFLFELPDVCRTIEEPCIHVGGDDNYAHWVQRNLLKLALLEGTEYEKLPLLVTEDLTAFQKEYLEMLGVPESRLVKVPRPALVHCRTLIVPTALVYQPKVSIGVRWLRGQLAPWMDPGPPKDLLYLSRSDARKRRIVNEDELRRRIGELGFRAITPGELGVAEQIRAVSRARVIVGPHGAAFANLVFAPPGSAVVEINTTLKQHMTDFVLLANAASLRREAVISDDYDFTRPEPYPPDADFRVEVDEVLGALRRLEPDLKR
jgi:capsular polysaccharide biosynthesis protein